jgi:DNA-binding response OmpR family regulator
LEGTEVCRRLRRAQPVCVIIILTARSAEMDLVLGLDSGADDFLVKPVRVGELQARLRAHLRRTEVGAATPEVRRLGDLVVDERRRRVTVAGQELHLRPKEFDLLARLAAEPDVALRRETLMSDVWDARWFGSTKTLDVHVAALRRRIAEKTAAVGAVVPASSRSGVTGTGWSSGRRMRGDGQVSVRRPCSSPRSEVTGTGDRVGSEPFSGVREQRRQEG